MTRQGEQGFSVIEAVFAVSLMAVGVASLAYVAIAAGRANVSAQAATIAQHAARERLEQLRALAWATDSGIVPISDWSSDLTITPPRANEGSGVAVSPPAAITANTPGFCDFLDANGQWMASGSRAPAGAAWTRRWSISAMDGLADTLILQVVVVPTTVQDDARAAAMSNGTWLVTMRSRHSR